MQRNMTVGLIAAVLSVTLIGGIVYYQRNNVNPPLTLLEDTTIKLPTTPQVELESITPEETIDEEIESVNVKQIEARFEENESFFLVIESATCSYCVRYKEETLIHYEADLIGIPLYVLEITSDFSDQTTLNAFLDRHELILEGTPATYLIKKGVNIETQLGVKTLDDLKKSAQLVLN